MYCYELCAEGYEDSCPERWILTHEKKYTQEEFDKIVDNAIPGAKQYLTGLGYPPYDWYDMLLALSKYLVMQYGFKHLEIQARFEKPGSLSFRGIEG